MSLTLEEGPKAVWDRATLEKLKGGKWDSWIGEVILGTNEDEGSIFAFGGKVRSSFSLTRIERN